MKYFQLVKKLGSVGMLAIFALALMQTSSLSAITPTEKAAKVYLLTLIGRGTPDNLNWQQRCDKIIELLLAINDPKYNPILDAVREVRNMRNPCSIVNRLRRADVLAAIAAFPREPGEQPITLDYVTVLKIVKGLVL